MISRVPGFDDLRGLPDLQVFPGFLILAVFKRFPFYWVLMILLLLFLQKQSLVFLVLLLSHMALWQLLQGVYRFSSLVKQNKKAKICFVIYIAGERFFFLYL